MTGELRENLSLAVQTMTARGGGITREAEQAALPAAQTATGLQILQQQKNKLDNSLEKDPASRAPRPAAPVEHRGGQRV